MKDIFVSRYRILMKQEEIELRYFFLPFVGVLPEPPPTTFTIPTPCGKFPTLEDTDSCPALVTLWEHPL